MFWYKTSEASEQNPAQNQKNRIENQGEKIELDLSQATLRDEEESVLAVDSVSPFAVSLKPKNSIQQLQQQHSHSSSKSYQAASEKYVSLINSLSELGASSAGLLDIPRIVVAGNQSVGKSSLLEGISGIKLPRGDGTCTRCVMEVRMSTASPNTSSSSWNCTVKLQRKERMDQEDALHTAVFGSTQDPAVVEELVRKAQKALLNPSTDASQFLFGPSSAATTADELLFSQDTVIIEITGSKLNLSLIDLPGIIKSVQSQKDQQLIPLIESVITSYISHANTLILAVFTCKDDMENQQIFRMAREVDPTGYRTIGVLTKPDTIEKGTHERWIQILTGRLYYLKLGYFMVKMPSKRELQEPQGNSGNRAQDGFFESSPFWIGTFSKMPERFGIASLQSELGSLLTGLIENCLPLLKQSTQLAILEVNQSLETLPPPPGPDAKIELLQIIRHYSTLVSYHISAQQNLKVFNQKIKRHYESFKDAISSTRPRLVASKAAQSALPATSSSFWRRSSTPTDSPPKQPSSSASSSPGTRAAATIDGAAFTMEDLKFIVSAQKGKELDGHAPYGAFEHLVRKSQVDWKSMVSLLINSVAVELENLTGKLVQEVFGRFPNLRARARNLVQVLQGELTKSTSEMIGHAIAMEARHPFTLASSVFINGKQRELDHLQQQLLSTSLSSEPLKSGGNLQNEALKRAVNALHEAGVRGLSTQTLLTRISPQTNESYLLDLMASSMSYFDISSSRFMDGVCLKIDYHFLLAFSEFLEKEMVDGLGILEETGIEGDGLLNLLVEDAVIVKKRDALRRRKAKLESIWRRLQLFDVE